MPDVTAIDEDILVAEYQLHAKTGLIDIRDEFEKRLKIKNTPHLLMVKIHGMAIFDQDAQSFIAGEEEGDITRAVAILCDKEVGYYEHGKLLIKYFVGVKDLRFPVELFDNENDAINWLKSQK